jgi:hypothetical protein
MRLSRYLIRGAAGAAVAVAIALLSGHFKLWLAVSAENGLDQSLVLAGFLFVPAAIFTVVVGAMFPTYSNATPVMVIRKNPLLSFLPWLALTLGYGVGAIACRSVFKASWLVALPMLGLVGFGAIRTVQLVGYSLTLLDPIRLTDWIASYAMDRKGSALVVPAFNDLCRLLRGMCEGERPITAENIMKAMMTSWERHSDKLQFERPLALRVLKECEVEWSRRPQTMQVIGACRDKISGE